MSAHGYEPLEGRQIRILDIQPRTDTGLLKCKMRSVTLGAPELSFGALSWTWGRRPKPEDYAQIEVNGRPHLIWPSLYETLSGLSKEEESVCLWVDAICIDQENTEEISRQIPMMDQVYSKASDVHIWLGTPANDSDFILETVRNQHKDEYVSERFLVGLYKLMQRPWWQRMWVVQEYVLNQKSPQIYCGRGPSVSADALLDVFSQAYHNTTPQMVPTFYANGIDISTFRSQMWIRGLRHSRHVVGPFLAKTLGDALYGCRHFQVTVPRDKVYGILGMVDPTVRAQFKVDASLTAEEVYHQAALHLLQYEKSSTFLYDFPLARNQSTPTWVPSFNPDFDHPIRLFDETSPHLKQPLEDITISGDNLHLSVRGYTVSPISKVIDVGNISIKSPEPKVLISNVVQLLRLLHNINDAVETTKAQRTDGTLFEPLWKTLIAGCFSSTNAEELKDEVGLQTRLDECLSIAPDDESMENIMLMLQQFSKTPDLLTKIHVTLSAGRNFFIGEDGSYGISESGIQTNDVLALLFPQHYIPVVLRKKEDVYEMVGTAYVPQAQRDAILSDTNRASETFVIA